jgi:hypothetical protein
LFGTRIFPLFHATATSLGNKPLRIAFPLFRLTSLKFHSKTFINRKSKKKSHPAALISKCQNFASWFLKTFMFFPKQEMVHSVLFLPS